MKYGPEVHQEWINELSRKSNWSKLNQWERDFLISVEKATKNKRDLSPAREETLEKLYADKT